MVPSLPPSLKRCWSFCLQLLIPADCFPQAGGPRMCEDRGSLHVIICQAESFLLSGGHDQVQWGSKIYNFPSLWSAFHWRWNQPHIISWGPPFPSDREFWETGSQSRWFLDCVFDLCVCVAHTCSGTCWDPLKLVHMVVGIQCERWELNWVLCKKSKCS